MRLGDDMEISKKLQEQRKMMKLSQEELANRLNVSRQTISSWETGKSYPDIYSLVSISDIYGLTLDELVKGDVKMLNTMKKESKAAQVNKKAMIMSGIGLIGLGLGWIIPTSHVREFISGAGFGLLIAGALMMIVAKVVLQLSDK